MKFGINTVLWVWPFTSDHLHLFKKIKDMGFDLVEIALEDRSSSHIAKIKEGLRHFDLGCCICGNFGPERDVLSEDESVQKRAREYIKESIDICKELGAGILVGPTYSVGIKPEFLLPEKKEEMWQRSIRNLQKVCPYAEENNVIIAVEALNRYETNFITTVDDALKLVKKVDSPALKIHLDTYHMNIEEKNLGEAIEKAGDFLYHFHASENDRGTPGSGNVNWEDVAHSLKKINYNKSVVIESVATVPKNRNLAEAARIWRSYEANSDTLARDGLKFLKQLLTKGD